MRIDLGKGTKLGKIRTALDNSIRAEDIVIIDGSDDTSLHQLGFYGPAVTRYVFIMVLNFVALDRKPCVVAAIVPGHVIILQPQYVERKTKAQILVAVKGQSPGFESLGFGEVHGFLNTGRDIGADVTHRHTLN